MRSMRGIVVPFLRKLEERLRLFATQKTRFEEGKSRQMVHYGIGLLRRSATLQKLSQDGSYQCQLVLIDQEVDNLLFI